MMKVTTFSLLLALIDKVSPSVIRRDSTNVTWNTAQCTQPEITDASIDQTIRWNSVDTEGAWKAALDDWHTKGSAGGLTFTQAVSNFFHGPEQMLCGDTSARDGCGGTNVECSDVNHPGGMFILNSSISLSSVSHHRPLTGGVFVVTVLFLAGLRHFRLHGQCRERSHHPNGRFFGDIRAY